MAGEPGGGDIPRTPADLERAASADFDRPKDEIHDSAWEQRRQEIGGKKSATQPETAETAALKRYHADLAIKRAKDDARFKQSQEEERQKIARETAATPQDVGRALLEEDRRLGGKMGLRMVPTGENSTTILLPYLTEKGGQFRTYGVNSEQGLVSYVDYGANSRDSWNRYSLPKELKLRDVDVRPITTPDEMEEWTTALALRRESAERDAARAAKQTDFERSLPQKAMEAIQKTPIQPAAPQGPIQ